MNKEILNGGFSGKTALITGAAVGIGRAVAMKFAQNSVNVILLDINYNLLENVKKELERYNTNILIFRCDVSNEAEVNKIVAEATRICGKIDILVNNAAIWRTRKPFSEISTEEWNNYLNINIMGTVIITRAVLKQMLKNGYGKIINVSSVAGVYGNANMVQYSTTKGAIIAFTKALAKEVSDKGVLVNCVSPGSVSSSENRDVNFSEPSELSFIGRTGTDMENANLIYFLASDEASYISGQNIQIDGCRKKQ